MLHMQFVSDNTQPITVVTLITIGATLKYNKKLTFSVFKAVARRKADISKEPVLNVQCTDG